MKKGLTVDIYTSVVGVNVSLSLFFSQKVPMMMAICFMKEFFPQRLKPESLMRTAVGSGCLSLVFLC